MLRDVVKSDEMLVVAVVEAAGEVSVAVSVLVAVSVAAWVVVKREVVGISAGVVGETMVGTSVVTSA